MITDFDKNNIAAHFKAEFAKRLSENDYEGAIDYLIKYSDEKNFSDFHLICGMLYLQMTQDSDDAELYTMAFREFMMHLRRHPDCRNAYRNLLATLFLRGDALPILACGSIIKNRGFELDSILDELSDAGILMLSDSVDEPPDIDGLFKAGEFGELDNVCAYADGENEFKSDVAENGAKGSRGSKIIRFGGKTEAPTETETPCHDDAPKSNDMASADMPDILSEEIYEDILRHADEDGFDLKDIYNFADSVLGRTILKDIESGIACESYEHGGSTDMNAEPSGDEIMRKAEMLLEGGNYRGALEELGKIKRKDEHYYYCGLAMRAFIYLEYEDLAVAESLLNEAAAMRQGGALVGTLLCRLYELQGRYSEIPPVLKGIDVKDFIDGNHVYKAFRLALAYCGKEDAAALAKDYIDEYNILDMRRLYAQMRYNDGDKAAATHELYMLSRVFYDDINARYYYLRARAGDENLPIDEEAPQEILNAVVEDYMKCIKNGGLTQKTVESEHFLYSVEFFLTLEYRNERKLLVKMFDAVRATAAEPLLESKVRDALVSPYVEPIVKAIILGELLKKNNGSDFLLEIMYCPISSDDLRSPEDGYPSWYYWAYAFVVVFCKNGISAFRQYARDLRDALCRQEASETDIAYYLIKNTVKSCYGCPFDDRIAYALGYSSKSAAERAYKTLSDIAYKYIQEHHD